MLLTLKGAAKRYGIEPPRLTEAAYRGDFVTVRVVDGRLLIPSESLPKIIALKENGRFGQTRWKWRLSPNLHQQLQVSP